MKREERERERLVVRTTYMWSQPSFFSMSSWQEGQNLRSCVRAHSWKATAADSALAELGALESGMTQQLAKRQRRARERPPYWHSLRYSA
jgi:hypothetical protein